MTPIVCIAAFATSLSIAFLIAKFGHLVGLTDIPNQRSSHLVPVPRGGGLGIVLSFLIGTFVLTQVFSADTSFSRLLVACAVVAAISLLDDFWSLPAYLRLVVQVAAACGVVQSLPASWSIQFLPSMEIRGWIGFACCVVYMVWTTNLYNFMDGIDGLAGAQGLFLSLAGAWLVASRAPDHALVTLLLILAFACAGFLALNWSPAKVFMGDVGSSFLGFTFGAMAVLTAAEHVLSIWTWLILSGVFFVDASITLLRRALAGLRIDTPHRTHAYQRLATKWSSHRSVAVLSILINLCWLLPLAWVSSREPDWAPVVCLVAFAPLATGVWLVGAGRSNPAP